MPDQPDLPGGSNDPTRAHDPIDPTRADGPIDPTRVQPGVDPTRAEDATRGRSPARAAVAAPLVDEPRRGRPDDDRDRKGAWWLWALLAAVLIGIVVFALLSGDDDDDAVGTADQTQTEEGASDTTPEDTAPADTTVDTAPADTASDDAPATEDTPTTTAPAVGGDAAAPGTGEDPGTVTTASDGTDLFTLVQGDAGDAERLAPYADQDVTGEGVSVLDIVEGEGFWIGSDETKRVFAHVSSDAAAAVQVGQRINFDGFLKPNPATDSADVHDIPEDQGAELHRQQGHHIELRSLTPA